MAVLVFEALALGLALPYLVLAFAPGAAKALPRPGPWMDQLKQILAFPMYGVAAWLFWVLAQQVDSTGLAAALSGFVLIGFAAWLWKRSGDIIEDGPPVERGGGPNCDSGDCIGFCCERATAGAGESGSDL